MSWHDDLHVSDPVAWQSMAEAGRIPSAATANDVCHAICFDADGHSDGCIVVEDE